MSYRIARRYHKWINQALRSSSRNCVRGSCGRCSRMSVDPLESRREVGHRRSPFPVDPTAVAGSRRNRRTCPSCSRCCSFPRCSWKTPERPARSLKEYPQFNLLTFKIGWERLVLKVSKILLYKNYEEEQFIFTNLKLGLRRYRNIVYKGDTSKSN